MRVLRLIDEEMTGCLVTLEAKWCLGILSGRKEASIGQVGPLTGPWAAGMFRVCLAGHSWHPGSKQDKGTVFWLGHHFPWSGAQQTQSASPLVEPVTQHQPPGFTLCDTDSGEPSVLNVVVHQGGKK